MSALVLTVAVAAFFVWAGASWLDREAGPPGPRPEDMSANEVAAVAHLREIEAAQERYRERDWDGDGRLTYAAFLVHLWRTVDGGDRPVDVGLIDRKLALAMGVSLAVDGYYFVDMRLRPGLGPRADKERLDHEREWSIAAVPSVPGESGRYIFLRHPNGLIYTREAASAPPWMVPRQPLAEGWTR